MYKEEGLRCRSCLHNNHYDFDRNIVLAQCRHYGGYYLDYEKCNCNEFVPLDNLEYLEYLYDKKEKQCL